MAFKKHLRLTENVELMYNNQILKVVKCFTCRYVYMIVYLQYLI